MTAFLTKLMDSIMPDALHTPDGSERFRYRVLAEDDTHAELWRGATFNKAVEAAFTASREQGVPTVILEFDEPRGRFPANCKREDYRSAWRF